MRTVTTEKAGTRRWLAVLAAIVCACNPLLGWWPARMKASWYPPASSLETLRPDLETEATIGFFVDRSGLYELAVDWDSEPIPSELFVYAGQFKRSLPLARVIAGTETGGAPRLRVPLAAGEVYYAVVSAKDAGPDEARLTVEGPGVGRLSYCYLLDDEDYGLDEADDCFQAQDLAFALSAVGPGANAATCPDSGINHQTADGADFGCAGGASWELSVRVLDRCALNGHYWVVANRLANRSWVFTVDDRFNLVSKTWELPFGRLDQNLVDRTAFPCRPAKATE